MRQLTVNDIVREAADIFENEGEEAAQNAVYRVFVRGAWDVVFRPDNHEIRDSEKVQLAQDIVRLVARAYRAGKESAGNPGREIDCGSCGGTGKCRYCFPHESDFEIKNTR